MLCLIVEQLQQAWQVGVRTAYLEFVAAVLIDVMQEIQIIPNECLVWTYILFHCISAEQCFCPRVVPVELGTEGVADVVLAGVQFVLQFQVCLVAVAVCLRFFLYGRLP